jgi:uncharacterized RDD family membrane protein YckC
VSSLVPPTFSAANAPSIAVPAPKEIGKLTRRFFAFVLDEIILGGGALLIGIPLFSVLSRVGVWGRLIGFCIALPYFAILESSIGRGQTLGKRALSLQVVDVYGKTISFQRALLRYAIFAIPFFVNGAALPFTRTPWMVSNLIVPAVSILGFANLYLIVCNRHTRQGIHDLAVGSFVTDANHIGSVAARAIWKWHWAILGTLVVVFCLVSGTLLKKVEQLGPFPQLFRDIALIEKMDGVQQASAQKLTNYFGDGPKKVSLIVTIRWTGKYEDQEAFADRAAKVIVENDPNLPADDMLQITVVRGYDLGFAHFSMSHTVDHTTAEWKSSLPKPPSPPCATANCT